MKTNYTHLKCEKVILIALIIKIKIIFVCWDYSQERNFRYRNEQRKT